MTGETTTPDAPERRLAVSWAWAEHLGTALTVGYLALIAVGMFHNVMLYLRFRINILDFAEPSDFLLAPLRDPLVAVATVVPILLIGWYLRYSERMGEQSRRRRRAAGLPIAWWETKEENVERLQRQMVWLRPLTILLWVVASGLWYERRAADRIMMGDGERVTVETTDGAKQEGTANRPLMLLGTTSRYLFLFRTDDWKTVILPTDNVLRITPVRPAQGLITIRPRMIRLFDSTATR
jgi:hypothetical protein